MPNPVEVPTSKGRKFKSEQVNTKETINFDLPERDPGRVPSLSRPIVKPKKPIPITRVPPGNIKLKVEQELAIVVSGPPPIPKAIPHTNKEEKPPNLLELI